MKLVLVYKADDGLFNALSDTAHKIFSPATYECRLCYFTYGITGMVRKWKNYLETIPLEKVFYHRKEYFTHYQRFDINLPAILLDQDGKITLLLSSNDIEACENLGELQEALQDRLLELKIVADKPAGAVA